MAFVAGSIQFINPDTGDIVWVDSTKEAVDKAYDDGLLPYGEEAWDYADEVAG
jgi:hypothetical protein